MIQVDEHTRTLLERARQAALLLPTTPLGSPDRVSLLKEASAPKGRTVVLMIVTPPYRARSSEAEATDVEAPPPEEPNTSVAVLTIGALGLGYQAKHEAIALYIMLAMPGSDGQMQFTWNGTVLKHERADESETGTFEIIPT